MSSINNPSLANRERDNGLRNRSSSMPASYIGERRRLSGMDRRQIANARCSARKHPLAQFDDFSKSCVFEASYASNMDSSKYCSCLLSNKSLTAVVDTMASNANSVYFGSNKNRSAKDNEIPTASLMARKYQSQLGDSALASINSIIEQASIYSKLASSDSDLNKISSCRVNGILDSMKEALSSCEDQDVAKRNFSALFSRSIGKGKFGKSDYANKKNWNQIKIGFDDFKNNILENSRIWSSDSILKTSANKACISMSDYMTYESLSVTKDELPDTKLEYDNYRFLWMASKQFNIPLAMNGMANKLNRNPLVRLLYENENLRASLGEDKTIRDAIKDPLFKDQLLDAMANDLSSKCEAFSKPDNYKKLFCPSSIKLDPNIVADYSSLHFYNEEEGFNEKDEGRQSTFFQDLTSQVLACKNSGEDDNPIMSFLSPSKRHVSIKEDMFAEKNTYTEILLSQAKETGGLDLNGQRISQEELDEAKESSFNGAYEAFNNSVCPLPQQKISYTLPNDFLGRFPEEIRSKISAVAVPDDILTNQESYKNYIRDVHKIYRKHVYDKVEKENPNLSKAEQRRLAREQKEFNNSDIGDFLKVVEFKQAASFMDLQETLEPKSEDPQIIAEKPPVMDYFFNATAEDEAILSASSPDTGVTEPNDFSTGDSFTPSRNSSGVGSVSTTNRTRRYTARGIPSDPIGETIFEVETPSLPQPIATPKAISEAPVVETPVDETPVVVADDEPRAEDRNPIRLERDEGVVDGSNFDLQGPGLVLSSNPSNSTFRVLDNDSNVNKDVSDNNQNSSNNETDIADSQQVSPTAKRAGPNNNSSMIDQLRSMRDALASGNSALKDRLNSFKRSARSTAGRNSGNFNRTPASISNNNVSRGSRNPYEPFSSETVSSSDSGSDVLQDKIEEAKNEGKFTDKPSSFGNAAGSGAGGSSGGKGSKSVGSSGGGPGGSGIIGGPAGGIFIPKDGQSIGDGSFDDPLAQIVDGLFKLNEPHILDKVIPHSLILNDPNGMLGLVESLGLEGRRFTTLDVYYVTKEPSYIVRIYDYDIGDNVVNDLDYRRRIIKTINVLKKEDEATEQYMKGFYKDGKYNNPDEILGAITSKLKLMYERPACSNPDYDRSTTCVHPDEINELKGNILSQDEMVDLIEYNTNLKLH